jgi:hypothetical protein
VKVDQIEQAMAPEDEREAVALEKAARALARPIASLRQLDLREFPPLGNTLLSAPPTEVSE